MRPKLKNIMCLTDLSTYSNQTIDYGIALAKEFESRLYLCHVVDIPSMALYAEAHIDPMEQQSRIISQAEATLGDLTRGEEIDWQPLITVGPTVSEISRLVVEKNIDLAISASHGRSGLKRLVLGSVTEELIRTISCPMLVMRGPEKSGMQPEPVQFHLKKIMVGCDFSSDSTLALRYALSLAQEFEAELHLVHVMEPTAYQNISKTITEAEKSYQDELRKLLGKKLDNLVPEDARNWCFPKTALLDGRADEKIVEYAKQNQIDLISLGVRGHGLVETLFLGSTTDRVARQAPCPVLSVRPVG
ncbi:MAG: universal stress protein [Desulfobacterales bacterium]|nr:universal stress protein [Desulfobacterales bacterium]